jgi:hypothetical protein
MISPALSDTAVPSEQRLCAILRDRLGSRVRNLRVVLHGDGVVLQGRATSYHVKQLAQHAAMELGGLRVVANDIEVMV